jgi:hypothetical protein
MLRILIAAFSIACWRTPVVFESDIEEMVLANVEMETNEIVASTEAGDLLNTNWNLKGVEAGTPYTDSTGFGRSLSATISSQLETQIATGAWAKRIANSSYSNSLSFRCRSADADVIPSTLPPFEMSWLTDDFWQLTRSYVQQDTDHNAQITSFDFLTY